MSLLLWNRLGRAHDDHLKPSGQFLSAICIYARDMADTSSRLFRLLSLLQHHRHWPGWELADRLEVSERTLRRDVERLRQLGYPVESSRGVDGGYELSAGPTMPPLLLDEREAIALAVGLHGAAHSIHTDVAEASVSALAKVVGMLPASLRGHVELVGDVTVTGRWGSGTNTVSGLSADVLGRVAQACRDGVRLRFDYSAADGTASQRYVEPYRLVSLASRWYLFAHDIDRNDWRTFRVDRLSDPQPTRNTFDPRPLPSDDLVAYVRERIASVRKVHHVEVLVDAPADRVEQAVGNWATVTATDDPARTRFTMDVDSLDWPVLVLSALAVDFEVVEPDELATRLRECGARFARCA
jgi:predicted DNA-binding transcriptional regulator YafY